jgi:hypothetical protein
VLIIGCFLLDWLEQSCGLPMQHSEIVLQGMSPDGQRSPN